MATDEQIAEAFNAGYTMQKIDPAMVEKLLSTKNDSEIMNAMAQGAKQLEREKIIHQQQEIKERSQIKTHKR
ncbi:hypothetical protein [Mucilaginibacter ginsenosidivorax]|uniref:Uncharacterized protein n=1 Tax=Mucilaginibacter ginsenosidivorax TaxID=862126 RepID=A0A5B8W5J6_9SPHI|nr:hypothetical protein [Mucilaginibacter ginsenosidivorax]QEC79350.1 hypothetical protein FSB76_26625 [Mucilaginibacter ginsenosidivorax]